jgi:hypothetical protein
MRLWYPRLNAPKHVAKHNSGAASHTDIEGAAPSKAIAIHQQLDGPQRPPLPLSLSLPLSHSLSLSLSVCVCVCVCVSLSLSGPLSPSLYTHTRHTCMDSLGTLTAAPTR